MGGWESFAELKNLIVLNKFSYCDSSTSNNNNQVTDHSLLRYILVTKDWGELLNVGDRMTRCICGVSQRSRLKDDDMDDGRREEVFKDDSHYDPFCKSKQSKKRTYRNGKRVWSVYSW